ncbi:MAG: N-acetyl-gamma-glutamyl-phosphate reductase [Candidatus Omnitrophica bacterium]|nr:N-acetyl-gamma-glutamyl-phosphate reductase [Candidatus Omnitrophota bacterium]
MLKIGIVGATGYTGEELVKILSRHSGVEVLSLSAIIDKPTKISEVFPSLAGKCDIICKELDIEEVCGLSDLVFLALPHTVSMQFAPKFLKEKKRVIDLSADYRLPAKVYKEWYAKEHMDKAGLDSAVYGLPEVYRKDIKKADLIANPGCYPTSIILAGLPLVKEGVVELDDIIADSKSGVTGAGRKAAIPLIFSEVNENLKAYKIDTHQHKPEISQELSKAAGKGLDVVFTPHLIPMNRGILSTLYFKLKKKMTAKDIAKLYKRQYKNEPFVKISKGLPQIKDVVNTNYCEIGVSVSGNRAIIVSCIDNLLKGAAGQAVQNMNIMCGFKEAEGLIS